jgi:hypothetical protein
VVAGNLGISRWKGRGVKESWEEVQVTGAPVKNCQTDIRDPAGGISSSQTTGLHGELLTHMINLVMFIRLIK